MVISFDEKEMLKELNCLRVELNSKPDLMAQTVNSEMTLVLIVDMINGFCKTGNLSSPRCEKVIQPIKQFLLDAPKARKVFFRDCHSNSAAEFKWFPIHCNTAEESAVVAELNGFDAEDMPKNSTNGFFNLIQKIPDISYYGNIIITGVCTDICVMQLALTLRAYLNETNAASNVLVLTDLVETYHSGIHNAELMNMFALKTMEQAGVQLFKNVK